MLRALADLDPNEGEVAAGNVERGSMAAPQWRRMVGFVPAESGWWSDIVGDHFADRQGAAEIIERLGLPAEALDWQVSRLSTGERHRLALLRALIIEPGVLLLDEPTAALDETATGNIEKLLRERMTLGTAIVLVTHDVAQVKRIADFVMQVKEGRAGAPEPVK